MRAWVARSDLFDAARAQRKRQRRMALALKVLRVVLWLLVGVLVVRDVLRWLG